MLCYLVGLCCYVAGVLVEWSGLATILGVCFGAVCGLATFFGLLLLVGACACVALLGFYGLGFWVNDVPFVD